MEFVRRIKQRAEALKAMGAEQLAQLQKSEREQMFREEYTIRRYYEALKMKQKHVDEINWEVMSSEDAAGHARRAIERRDNEWVSTVAHEVELAVKARSIIIPQFKYKWNKDNEITNKSITKSMSNNSTGGTTSGSLGDDDDAAISGISQPMQLQHQHQSNSMSTTSTTSLDSPIAGIARTKPNTSQSTSSSLVKLKDSIDIISSAAYQTQRQRQGQGNKHMPITSSVSDSRNEKKSSIVSFNNNNNNNDDDTDSVSPSNKQSATVEKWKEATIKKHFKVWDESLLLPELQTIAACKMKLGVRAFERITTTNNSYDIKSFINNHAKKDGISSAPALASMNFVADSRHQYRLQILGDYRQTKKCRIDSFQQLVRCIILFETKHSILISIRDKYRNTKFHSRQVRQDALKTAISLEKELLELEEKALKTISDSQMHVRQEVTLFAQLFLNHDYDPCLDADRDDAAEEKRIQEELAAIAATSSYHNNHPDELSGKRQGIRSNDTKPGSISKAATRTGARKPRVVTSSDPEADALGIAAKKVLARSTYIKKNHHKKTVVAPTPEPIADEARDYWQAMIALGLVCAPPPIPPPPPDRYQKKAVVVFVEVNPEGLIRPLTPGTEVYKPGAGAVRNALAASPTKNAGSTATGIQSLESSNNLTKSMSPILTKDSKESNVKRNRRHAAISPNITSNAATATATAASMTMTSSTNSMSSSTSQMNATKTFSTASDFILTKEDVTDVKYSYQMPGLNHFVSDVTNQVDFIQYGNEFIEWMRSVVHWFEGHERHWRLCHELHIVSFLQKLYWLISLSVDESNKDIGS